MELIGDWISRYGYFGIFSLLVLGIVGLPVPDETLLTFAGYLIFRGKLRPLPTYLAALTGSMCGITLSYTLGRVTGYFLLEKYGARLHIKMERVRKVHDWFHRIGAITLIDLDDVCVTNVNRQLPALDGQPATPVKKTRG